MPFNFYLSLGALFLIWHKAYADPLWTWDIIRERALTRGSIEGVLQSLREDEDRMKSTPQGSKKIGSHSLNGHQYPLNQYIIQYSSRSGQGANHDDPRIILPLEQGKLILAFNSGNHGHNGHNKLEVSVWDEEGQAFKFKLVSFEGGKVEVDENPQSCKKCHGEDLRPNWDGYPDWPGSIGSDDGGLKGREEEIYRKFEEKRKDHPRYGLLGKMTPSFGSGTNSDFNQALESLNKKRICRILKSSLDLKQRLILLLLNSCSSRDGEILSMIFPDRPEIEEEFVKYKKAYSENEEEYNRMRGNLMRKHGVLKQDERSRSEGMDLAKKRDPAMWEQYRGEEETLKAKINFVLEKFGLDLTFLSTNFPGIAAKSGYPYFSDGYGSFLTRGNEFWIQCFKDDLAKIPSPPRADLGCENFKKYLKGEDAKCISSPSTDPIEHLKEEEKKIKEILHSN